ncbi:MAG: alkaline phosphatase D family protein, partial [Gammaproteobacteria bacterium]
AYMSYQWSHGPRRCNNCYESIKGEIPLPNPSTPVMYYDFLCGGYPFFVLDVRTERYRDDIEGSINDNHMLGRPSLDPTAEPSQLDRLVHWLINQQQARGNCPKFIASSSVFTPNTVESTKSEKYKEASDSWPGYPKTRRSILDCIVKNNIQNVIFLSGDIHCCTLSQMTFSDNPDLKAYNITSSAFYWPFPFADGSPSHYVHDSLKPHHDTFELSKGNGSMDYEAWGFSQADNFFRIDVDANKDQLCVAAFGMKGEQLVTRKQDGKLDAKPHILKLAKW